MEEDKIYIVQKALSKRSNYKLFKALYNGVDASESSLKSLGLQRRTFYYALRELNDIGIAVKKDGKYYLSPFGYFLYSMQDKLRQWFLKENEIKGITKLLNKNNDDELSYTLLKDLEEMVGLSNFEPVKVYIDWKSLTTDLSLLVNAKKVVKIATRYSDPIILKYLKDIVKKDVQIKIVSDRKAVAVRLANLSYLTLDNTLLETLNYLLSSPNVQIKVSNVQFSFIIVDKEEIGVEIPDPFDSAPLVAFRFKSPTVAERLDNVFEKLFEKGEEDPIYNIIKPRGDLNA
jgi:predicted transcriptional regulator